MASRLSSCPLLFPLLFNAFEEGEYGESKGFEWFRSIGGEWAVSADGARLWEGRLACRWSAGVMGGAGRGDSGDFDVHLSQIFWSQHGRRTALSASRPQIAQRNLIGISAWFNELGKD